MSEKWELRWDFGQGEQSKEFKTKEEAQKAADRLQKQAKVEKKELASCIEKIHD